ncbi:hypothetical protein WR25_02758 [Diploscapter pachys]|uniref:Uncharacterized protein n=1 Tax=Diploscapter pachys TaxID=2018661 RepID=A0A2A2KFL6_9BILA|nr:hypothetical protein WR25_02758 [Diploscapter pachys]
MKMCFSELIISNLKYTRSEAKCDCEQACTFEEDSDGQTKPVCYCHNGFRLKEDGRSCEPEPDLTTVDTIVTVTPPSLTTDIEPEELSTAIPAETNVEDIIRPQTTPSETRATPASIVIVDDRGNPLRRNEDGQIVRDDGTVIPTDSSSRPVGQDGSPFPTDSQNRYVLISEIQTTPSAIATDDTGRKIYPVIRPVSLGCCTQQQSVLGPGH